MEVIQVCAVETWDEYLKRRTVDIDKRAHNTGAQQSSDKEPSADQKSGCFDCAIAWEGAEAAGKALEHRTATKHQIWITSKP